LIGKKLGRSATHNILIILIGISFLLSCYLFANIAILGLPAQEGVLYTWVSSGAFHFDVALLLDRLSATMIFIVTFISLAVHVYTVGYMADDPGYERFLVMCLYSLLPC